MLKKYLQFSNVFARSDAQVHQQIATYSIQRFTWQSETGRSGSPKCPMISLRNWIKVHLDFIRFPWKEGIQNEIPGTSSLLFVLSRVVRIIHQNLFKDVFPWETWSSLIGEGTGNGVSLRPEDFFANNTLYTSLPFLLGRRIPEKCTATLWLHVVLDEQLWGLVT